jgi:hypothetical protein
MSESDNPRPAKKRKKKKRLSFKDLLEEATAVKSPKSSPLRLPSPVKFKKVSFI